MQTTRLVSPRIGEMTLETFDIPDELPPEASSCEPGLP